MGTGVFEGKRQTSLAEFLKGGGWTSLGSRGVEVGGNRGFHGLGSWESH